MRREGRASGSITGRVLDEGGQPLSGAPVSISTRGGGPPSTIASNAEGEFRIDNLDPGAYLLWSFLPGYVAARAPGALRERVYHRVGDFVTISLVKGGVITGAVLNTRGEPVVAVPVRTLQVRDAYGLLLRGTGNVRVSQTDDRGVYRIYGLEPGSHIVGAGGAIPYSGLFGQYDADAPTFYPSNTIDGAVELEVSAGQEATGIDIRYRHERGHTVSGTISGAAVASGAPASGVNVSLFHATNGIAVVNGWISGQEDDRAFALEGVADGEYDLLASRQSKDNLVMAAPTRRITVRGSDVTGLQLMLAPMASISGRLILEAAPENVRSTGQCAGTLAGSILPLPQETVIAVRRDGREATGSQLRSRYIALADSAPDAQGNWTLRGLDPGTYRFNVKPPGEDWYLHAITASASKSTPPSKSAPATKSTPAAKPPRAARTESTATPAAAATAAASRETLGLAPGEQVGGISITLAEGAAVLRGRIVAEGEGAPPLPPRLRAHLVPAEREQEDNALRFAEAAVAADGSFTFTHLAPGRYRLIARAVPVDEANEAQLRPLAWDAVGRVALRREAEASNIALDLQPCQRIDDYVLRFPK